MKKIILFSIVTLCITQTTYAYTITLKSGDIIQCQVIKKDDQVISPHQSNYLDNLRAIEGNPSLYFQKTVSPPQNDQTGLQKAVDLIDQNDLGGAELLLKDLVSKMPDDWKPRSKERGILSVAFWDIKEYRGSLACEKKAVGSANTIYMVGPSYSGAYYWLSHIEIARNSPKKALEYLEKAESLESDHPSIFLNRGYIYNRIGRYQEGYEEFKKSLNVRSCILTKHKAEGYSGMGASLIGLNKYYEAKEAFNKSLKFDPGNKSVFNDLQYIKHLMNMYVSEK